MLSGRIPIQNKRLGGWTCFHTTAQTVRDAAKTKPLIDRGQVKTLSIHPSLVQLSSRTAQVLQNQGSRGKPVISPTRRCKTNLTYFRCLHFRISSNACESSIYMHCASNVSQSDWRNWSGQLSAHVKCTCYGAAWHKTFLCEKQSYLFTCDLGSVTQDILRFQSRTRNT